MADHISNSAARSWIKELLEDREWVNENL
jgi:hypothetical protein